LIYFVLGLGLLTATLKWPHYLALVTGLNYYLVLNALGGALEQEKDWASAVVADAAPGYCRARGIVCTEILRRIAPVGIFSVHNYFGS
jgi:hypothetical protein